jgi:hypothetical protein
MCCLCWRRECEERNGGGGYLGSGSGWRERKGTKGVAHEGRQDLRPLSEGEEGGWKKKRWRKGERGRIDERHDPV